MATMEQKKAEAINRMKALKLYPNIIKEFEKVIVDDYEVTVEYAKQFCSELESLGDKTLLRFETDMNEITFENEDLSKDISKENISGNI